MSMKKLTAQTDFITEIPRQIRRKKILTLSELFELFHTQSRMTVFRKLKPLNYISSYSHSGKYYSLPEVAEFDEDGLWRVMGIGFSISGNLKNTLVQLIEKSSGGQSQKELQKLLNINVHNTLLELVRTEKIDRKKLENSFVYISRDVNKARKQIEYRQTMKYGLQDNELPDWLVIEVMAAIIRTSELSVDPKRIIIELDSRNVTITIETVNIILSRHDLKKTLD